MLGSTKEMETAVNKSGTLALVEPFLLAHPATSFAGDHYKHSQGRPKEWLVRFVFFNKQIRKHEIRNSIPPRFLFCRLG